MPRKRSGEPDAEGGGFAINPAKEFAYHLAQGFNSRQAGHNLLPGASVQALDDAKLSHYRDTAEGENWLRTTINESAYTDEELDYLREKSHHAPCADVEEKLRELSGGRLESVRVFFSGGIVNPNRQQWKNLITRFAANSAWYVGALLERTRSGVVAVSWGDTLRAIVESVAERARVYRLSPGVHHVTVIPTMGEPLGDEKKQRNCSSSALAALLAPAFAMPAKALTLEGILPVLPRGFPVEDVQKLTAQLFENMRDYAVIFGRRRNGGLLAETDAILTGAGSFHSPRWSAFASEIITQEAVTKAELQRLASGDIGGVPIPKPNLSQEDHRKFSAVRQLWTGIGFNHFEEIARRASGDAPGVILCSLGTVKGPIVKRLVCEERVVNHLLCDFELLNSLKAELRK